MNFHKEPNWKINDITFFIIHYGGFTLIYGFFVLFIAIGVLQFNFQNVLSLILAILLLFLRYGSFYVVDFLQKEKYKTVTSHQLLFAPYGRIFIIHATLIVGMIFNSQLSSYGSFVLVLIILKIFEDLIFENSISLNPYTKKIEKSVY